jgi:pimeloyl-ACP methyl ester carboxylesterase
MSQPVLHFVHANSYPAEVYRVFFQHLRQHYEVRALSMHAHNPAFPIRNGWHALTRELLSELERGQREPVVLVGHSMGGMLSLMAAKARPELVRAVLLLDSPVVAGWRAALLSAAKLARFDRHFPPARLSEKRRDRWPGRDAAYQHFANKSMFAKWPEEVLRDYIEHGLIEHPEGGVTLRFSRMAENRVYRSLPHHIGGMVRRFPVPVGFIGGADSEENRMAGLRATKRLARKHFKLLPGGHLFPMESPQAAADASHRMIQQLLLDGGRGGRA